MKRIIITTFIFAVLSSTLVFSQNITQVRKIKTKALEMYENYKSGISRLYQAKPGDNSEDAFIRRFSEDALIYNDVLPDNMLMEVSPQQYCNLYESAFKQSPCGHYSDLELLFPIENEDGKWEIQVTFRRIMEFYTQREFHYPKYEFNYTMTVVMDEDFKNVKIKGISVSNPLNQFFIIERPGPEYRLEYEGLQVDDWDEETDSRLFKSNDFDIQKFKVQDERYFSMSGLIRNQKDPHFYNVQQKWKDIFGIGINYTPWGFGNKIDNTRFSGISMKSNTLSLSLFYGLQIGKRQHDKSVWFFNIGLDLNRYYYKFSGSDYTEYPSVDADDDPYLRKIQINRLNEKINSISTSLSLSVSYLLLLAKQKQNSIFLAFELGAFAEYTFLLKNTYKINADYHGLYDYYDGVEFDHYYDYGNFDQSNRQILAEAKNLRYDYGFWGGVGCWISLDKSSLLKFNIGYKQGFTTPLEYKASFVISENKNSYRSLLPATRQGMRNLFIGVSYIRTISPKLK